MGIALGVATRTVGFSVLIEEKAYQHTGISDGITRMAFEGHHRAQKPRISKLSTSDGPKEGLSFFF